MDRHKTQKIILFGLGKHKDLRQQQARNLGSKMIRSLKNSRERQVGIIIPDQVRDHLQAFVEGIILGNYDPARCKTGEEKKKKEEAEIATVHLISGSWDGEEREALEKGKMIAESVNSIRQFVNTGPEQMNTAQMVLEAKTIAKEHGYRFTDLDKRQLAKLNMGGLLAVNRGSVEPAHMLILEHNAKLDEAPIVIVGKGIIFDTGGVSLKPAASMQDMHLDMAGAAVVLGVFQLLKKLNISRRVIGMIPVTDNAIGSKAYRPSEILTTYSGKTVEVLNTDAEGRLILCDALSYAIDHFKPKYLIDLATLTGACMVALGFRTAGLFGNDQPLVDLIKNAAERTDEPVCQLPITDADEKAMKGKIADMTNMAEGHPYAGSSRAAAFLKAFVDKTKWAHIDIAGTAYTKDPKDYEVPTATGYGVRMMIDLLEQMS